MLSACIRFALKHRKPNIPNAVHNMFVLSYYCNSFTYCFSVSDLSKSLLGVIRRQNVSKGLIRSLQILLDADVVFDL
jgi:hypothetical protein